MKTDNELIAEFMGFVDGGDYWSSNGKHYLKNDGSHRFYPADFKFDESLDWLLPVIEKFEINHLCMIEISIFLGSTVCKIQKKVNKTIEWQTVMESNSTVESIYKAVVEFIKWHKKCLHEGDEIIKQGDGFVYKTCADCGEDI